MQTKTLNELIDDLVYKTDETAKGVPNQCNRARQLLEQNPALVQVLRTPVIVGGHPKGEDPLGRVRDKFGAFGGIVELPLSQWQPLNTRFNKNAWERKVGIRAVKTADAIQEHPRAAVISLYNTKKKKNELIIERTLFRAVVKLVWFRLRSWYTEFLARD